MRITKTRLMRGPTINPNPPICKSKEPSFTYIRIFSCADDHLITEIAHYNWNLTEAKAAADGGTGTYTRGYMYEAAFKKYNSLDQKHCMGKNWVEIIILPGPYHEMFLRAQCYNHITGDIGYTEIGPLSSPNPNFPLGYGMQLILCRWENPTQQFIVVEIAQPNEPPRQLPERIYTDKYTKLHTPTSPILIPTCKYTDQ